MKNPVLSKTANALASLFLLAAAQACFSECLVSVEPERNGKRESPELYPLTAIVANADKFNGLELTTFGYFIPGHERSALCPSREVASTSECIYLSYFGTQEIEESDLIDRALMVMGRFTARIPGTKSFYAGKIEAWRISRIPEVKNASTHAEQPPDPPKSSPAPGNSTPAAGTLEKDVGPVDRH